MKVLLREPHPVVDGGRRSPFLPSDLPRGHLLQLARDPGAPSLRGGGLLKSAQDTSGQELFLGRRGRGEREVAKNLWIGNQVRPVTLTTHFGGGTPHKPSEPEPPLLFFAALGRRNEGAPGAKSAGECDLNRIIDLIATEPEPLGDRGCPRPEGDEPEGMLGAEAPMLVAIVGGAEWP